MSIFMLYFCLRLEIQQEVLMLPSEMVILMAIVVNKNFGKELLTRPMDITSEYIGYLYNSLVNRGYLKHKATAGYQLTAAGREAIFDFVKRNRTQTEDVVKRLQLLGIEVNLEGAQKIGKLEKDAINIR